MLKSIDIKQRIEWSDPEDVTEPKTIFVLRPLTSSEMLSLADGGDASKKTVGLIVASIVEVRNFGGETDIKTIVDSLPLTTMTSLSQKVAEINHLGAETRKNS